MASGPPGGCAGRAWQGGGQGPGLRRTHLGNHDSGLCKFSQGKKKKSREFLQRLLMFPVAVTNAFLSPKAPRSKSLAETPVVSLKRARKSRRAVRPARRQGQRARFTPGDGTDAQRSHVQSKCLLLKPQNGCFQDRCPHGPAGSPRSCTPSSAKERQPAAPRLGPAPHGRQENRWQAGRAAHRMAASAEGSGLRRPRPCSEQLNSARCPPRTQAFPKGLTRTTACARSWLTRRLLKTRLQTDASARTVKAVGTQRTSLGTTEPKSH